jgi:hypothetical protein
MFRLYLHKNEAVCTWAVVTLMPVEWPSVRLQVWAGSAHGNGVVCAGVNMVRRA